MKYGLAWRVRPGVAGQQAEADTRRAYELYSKWQPRVTILRFVGRVDAEGGFMVCEADNPADVLGGDLEALALHPVPVPPGHRRSGLGTGRSGGDRIPERDQLTWISLSHNNSRTGLRVSFQLPATRVRC